jgi:Mg2+ and Co2+ transporter CorA
MLKWLYKFSKKDHGSGTGPGYPKPKTGMLWVYGWALSNKEISQLSRDFGVHAKYFTSFLNAKRSTRHSFKPLCFTIADFVLQKNRITRPRIFYAVGKDFVLTVMEKPLEPFDTVFKRISDDVPKMDYTPGLVLYENLDEDTEENFDILSFTENRINELEKEILEGRSTPAVIGEIVELKRTLTNMSKAFWTSSKILFSIKKGLTPVRLSGSEMMLIDDVHDTFTHQIEIVGSQKEIITDAITIFQVNVSNRLATISNKINTSIRRLTWIMLLLTGAATILTVPNTVATVFGIPDWPLTTGNWNFVAFVLVLSTILPVIWFYFYWKHVKKQAEKEEKAGM